MAPGVGWCASRLPRQYEHGLSMHCSGLSPAHFRTCRGPDRHGRRLPPAALDSAAVVLRSTPAGGASLPSPPESFLWAVPLAEVLSVKPGVSDPLGGEAVKLRPGFRQPPVDPGALRGASVVFLGDLVEVREVLVHALDAHVLEQGDLIRAVLRLLDAVELVRRLARVAHVLGLGEKIRAVLRCPLKWM